MAPQYNTAPASAERRGAPILDRYLCRVCGVYKPNAHYSKKELNTYSFKHDKGDRVNAVTAKLRCRGCAGGSVNEIFCEGPCAEDKSLDKFSKNSRSAGGNRWCKTCTLWKESQEDGLISAAPPEAELAPDEDGGFFPGERVSSFYDPEAGDGGDDDDDEYGYSGSSAAWGMSDHRPAAPSSTASGSVRSFGTLNASLNSLSLSGGVEKTSSPLPKAARGSDWVPPHLRGASNNASTQVSSQTTSEVSSASNPYATKATKMELAGAEWTAVDARRRPAAPLSNPITFNGWDNTGRQQLQHRYPSSSERSTSDSGSVASAASTETVKAPGNVNRAPVRPANITAAPTGQKTNSSWAKPVGNRSYGSQYQASRPSKAPKQATGSDSDEDYM